MEKAAASVATVYAGILGFAFSVSDNPLPLRGVIPAVFLGLAIWGAAYYLAYPPGRLRELKTPDDNGSPDDDGSPDDHGSPDDGSLEEWTNKFTELSKLMVSSRGWALRASIVSLGFGALFLPAPFVKVKTTPPKPPTETPWPTLPSANSPLQRILFLEQVKEAARLRREGRRPGGSRPRVAWPKVPSANAPLERILFTERVKEVSRLRSEAKPSPVGQKKIGEGWIWLCAAVALSLVALAAIWHTLAAWAVAIWRKLPLPGRGHKSD